MQRKTITLVSILILGVGIAVFCSTLSNAVWSSVDETDVSPIPSTELEASLTVATTTESFDIPASPAQPEEWPVTLYIPKLQIAAHVQPVGISKKGNMAVPTNYVDVAWYRLGAAPGHMGSAVFNGHVDNGFGLPGVFKHLNEISIGDTIQTQAKNNTTTTYQVEDIETYPYDQVPLQAIFNRTDVAQLVIITCDGAWVGDKETYDHRLVVYAKLLPNL